MVLEVEIVVIFKEILVEIEETGGPGDNQDQEKEE